VDQSTTKIQISPFLTSPQRHKSIEINRYLLLQMILNQYHMSGYCDLFCRIWYIGARAFPAVSSDHEIHAFPAVFAHLHPVHLANLLHPEN
jgi:hypothetical protein